MSVQFCQPLNGQWQQFLLGYREKSLKAHLRERYMSTDQEKARRFHDEAVKDANRQIVIMRALLDSTQSIIEEDVAGGSTDETIYLNTEE